ncbi:MAG: ACT domain-containing protein, partial [Actinomycetota bacterium]
ADVYPALLGALRDAASDARAVKCWIGLARKDLVMYAALAREAFGSGRDPAGRARRLASSIGLEHFDALEVGILAGEREIFPAAAARLGVTEDRILDLASFVQTSERAGALYLLAVAENAMQPWERERLDELYGLVIEALGHPDLTGPGARDLVERRVEAVVGLLAETPARSVRAQVLAAPRRYLLAATPETIARHIGMATPKPGRFEARVFAEPSGRHEEWTVHVVVLDRRGALAAIAGAFAGAQVSVQDAHISTWRTGVAVDRFRVLAPAGTDWDAVRRRIEAALAAPSAEPSAPAVIEGAVEVDNLASPWHTVVEVRAADRAGLLHRVAQAMARAGLEIHQASLATQAGVAVDTFFVTGRNGGKLDEAGERALRAAFAGRAPRRLRWGRRPADSRVS